TLLAATRNVDEADLRVRDLLRMMNLGERDDAVVRDLDDAEIRSCGVAVAAHVRVQTGERVEDRRLAGAAKADDTDLHRPAPEPIRRRRRSACTSAAMVLASRISPRAIIAMASASADARNRPSN